MEPIFEYEEIEQATKDVESFLVQRYQAHALVSEVDFVVGAIAAINSLTCPDDKNLNEWMYPKVPPNWIFGPMGNRSIVAQVFRNRDETKAAEIAEEISLQEITRRRFIDDMVDFLHKAKNAHKWGLPEIKESAELILEELGELD